MGKVQLKEICSFSKGSQINGDELIENGEFDYLNGGINPSGKWIDYNVSGDTITISEGGNSCGYVNYMPNPFWCGAHCYYLYDLRCDVKYLFYALKSQQDRIMKLRSGACMPNIKKSDIGGFSFEYTEDTNIQNIIVYNLDKVTHTIDICNAILKKLDLLVKSRFVEMFGDPVLNPYNLPIASLAELSELITKGASPSWQGFSYTDDSSQTLFITSENVREGYIDISSPKYIEDGFNEKQKRSMIHKGDFLINIVGASIGRAAQFNLECKANMNQASALVRINDDRIRDKYLLTYLNSEKAQLMYDSMKSDTGRANLSLQDIGNLSILIPTTDSQIKFEKFVKQTDKSKYSALNIKENIRRVKFYDQF